MALVNAKTCPNQRAYVPRGQAHNFKVNGCFCVIFFDAGFYMCWTIPCVVWNNVFIVPDEIDSLGSSSAQQTSVYFPRSWSQRQWRNRNDNSVPLEGSPALEVILLFNGYLGFSAVSCPQCNAELLPCSRKNEFRDVGGARLIPALPCVYF